VLSPERCGRTRCYALLLAAVTLMLVAACSDKERNNDRTPANSNSSTFSSAANQTGNNQVSMVLPTSQTTPPGSPASPFSGGQFFLRFANSNNFPLRAVANQTRVTQISRLLSPTLSRVNELVRFNGDDVPVTIAQCDLVNAFYLSAGPEIVLCTELLDAAYSALLGLTNQDPQQAAQLSGKVFTFFLLHEIAHALDDLLDLPIFGNVESAADAIATVLAVETGTPDIVLYGAYLFTLSGDGSFGDVHHAGEDRAGDLVCWLLGSDPNLQSIEGLDSLGQRFVDAGRDCPSEYQDQRAAAELWIPALRELRRNSRAGFLPEAVTETIDFLPQASDNIPDPERLQLDALGIRLSRMLL